MTKPHLRSNPRHRLLTMACVLVGTGTSTALSAAPLTLGVEPGAVIFLAKPQTDRFKPGFGGRLAASYSRLPQLSLLAGISGMLTPSQEGAPGTALNIVAGFRSRPFRRPGPRRAARPPKAAPSSPLRVITVRARPLRKMTPNDDRDGDGIPDGRDRCPDQAETLNCYRDTDGCPDGVIALPSGLTFRGSSAKLRRNLRAVLSSIAAVIKRDPAIRLLRVEGYTDGRGRRGSNQRLSWRRAAAVRDLLITQGVNRQRLRVVGFGERCSVKHRDRQERRVLLRVVCATAAADSRSPSCPISPVQRRLTNRLMSRW